MPRLEKAKKQASCSAPTDRTIGQSARGGQLQAAEERQQGEGHRRRQGGARRREPQRRGGLQADLDHRPAQAEQDDVQAELEVGDAGSVVMVVMRTAGSRRCQPALMSAQDARAPMRLKPASLSRRSAAAAGATASPSARPARTARPRGPSRSAGARRAATWSRRRARATSALSAASQCGWSRRCQTTVSGLTLRSNTPSGS